MVSRKGSRFWYSNKISTNNGSCFYLWEKKRNEVNKYLIENTPSYRNYIDPEGQTVSHFSVEFGNDGVLDCLLENKYYSNAENDKGETPLTMAVRIERDDMVEKIEAYLEVNPWNWTVFSQGLT